MDFWQRKRKLWAALFQVVIVFFVFSAHSGSGYQPEYKSQSKTLLCASPGNSVVVRETTEPITSFATFFPVHLSIEQIWRAVAWFHTSELLTNTALQISNRSFNVFYVTTTIHAP